MKLIPTAAIATTAVASNLSIAEPQMLPKPTGEIVSNLNYAKPPATSEVPPTMRSSLSYMRPETLAMPSITSEFDE
ncbi:hypothetical protein [Burkholderia ambifaria]|uniref:hypothetical protein n=1 Tax=Burkholderia ambifaria TaxID=152480 RepID=UPI00158ED0A2|nr:hypothetical protein [Burkholderia ambifaria]